MFMGAILIALVLPAPAMLRLMLAALLVGTLTHLRRRGWGLITGQARLDDQGYWQWIGEDRRYRIIDARLDLFAIRLRLDCLQKRDTVLLVRDAVDAGVFHALCSRIQQHRLPARSLLKTSRLPGNGARDRV